VSQNSGVQLRIYIPEKITDINQTKAINSNVVEAMKIINDFKVLCT
jgi:hypothetical protein